MKNKCLGGEIIFSQGINDNMLDPQVFFSIDYIIKWNKAYLFRKLNFFEPISLKSMHIIHIQFI